MTQEALNLTCPDCGTVYQTCKINQPPVLARVAGSLTGDPGKWSKDQMAGGTVVKPGQPAKK